MNILITGASGYLGQRLSMKLAEKGHKIRAMIRNSKAEEHLLHANIEIFYGDILNRNEVKEAIDGCDVVFHLASLARIWSKNLDDFYTINVQGTINLLEESAEKGIKKFIYTSTTGVIGPSLRHPNTEETPRWSSYNNDYEISKHQAELEVLKSHKNGLPALIVSPSRIYGPGIDSPSSGVNNFIMGFLSKRIAFVAKNTTAVGNYVYIDDVVDGHIGALEKGEAGEKYILGGENLTFAEFFGTILRHSPKKGLLLRLPNWVLLNFAWLQVLASKALKKAPKITPDLVLRLGQNSAFDSSKAKEKLGYRITTFDEGIKNTVEFLTK